MVLRIALKSFERLSRGGQIIDEIKYHTVCNKNVCFVDLLKSITHGVLSKSW